MIHEARNTTKPNSLITRCAMAVAALLLSLNGCQVSSEDNTNGTYSGNTDPAIATNTDKQSSLASSTTSPNSHNNQPIQEVSDPDQPLSSDNSTTSQKLSDGPSTSASTTNKIDTYGSYPDFSNGVGVDFDLLIPSLRGQIEGYDNMTGEEILDLLINRFRTQSGIIFEIHKGAKIDTPDEYIAMKVTSDGTVYGNLLLISYRYLDRLRSSNIDPLEKAAMVVDILHELAHLLIFDNSVRAGIDLLGMDVDSYQLVPESEEAWTSNAIQYVLSILDLKFPNNTFTWTDMAGCTKNNRPVVLAECNGYPVNPPGFGG